VPRAARKIVLNKTGYNGMERYNKKGKFNVPPGWRDPRKDGSVSAPAIYDEDNIRSVSAALQVAALSCSDFEPILDQVPAGWFVYSDSPYIGTFTGYSQHGFGWHDQERLAKALRRASTRGVLFAYSNSDVDEARDLMAGFNLHTIMAPRNVSCDGETRGKVSELLVTNY
jgi:DNA adenine methylase